MTTDLDRLGALAATAAPIAVALRREIHRRPELGNREHETTHRIAVALEDAGLAPRVREAGTGLIVDIGDGEQIVAFRADLDALHVTEVTGAPYASEIPGVMHACGHDVHAAIGVGIARVLGSLEDVGGRVRIIFQPAEELIPGGALQLMEEGVVDGVDAIITFHVDPSLEPGKIGLRPGPITGASDRVTVTLSGPGGHTSRPHRTVDLLYAAGRVITDLPQALQHTAGPEGEALLVFGRIAGGSAANVIPTEIELGGTARVLSLELWRRMPELVAGLVEEIAAPWGARVHVDYEQGSPPVVNDADVIAAVAEASRRCLGPGSVTETHRSMGSEDFAWFLEKTPGALIRLGTALADRDIDLHSATFDIDESAIETGIIVGSAALLELLGRPKQ